VTQRGARVRPPGKPPQEKENRPIQREARHPGERESGYLSPTGAPPGKTEFKKPR
jgi:hypothetical protein